MSRRWASLGLAAVLAACAAQLPATLPPAPVAAGDGITVRAEPVPLDPADPARDRLGGFVYAGGVAFASDQTSRLHGLSDLVVDPDGRLTAVSDQGDLLSARLALDPAGRLVGLAQARLTALTDEAGQPLQGKVDADSEGLAVLGDGDRLVSFERRHRIWLYPAAGGPPRPAPTPTESLPDNAGLEALAALPAQGPDAYVAGAEDSGHTWICRLSAACAPGYAVPLSPGAGLTAAAALPSGGVAWLTRAWDPVNGARIVLSVRDAAGVERDRMRLAPPLTVDNFEGLAAVPLTDGRIRFYMVSDDNFSPAQRTLLLAFDWTPPRKEEPR